MSGALMFRVGAQFRRRLRHLLGFDPLSATIGRVESAWRARSARPSYAYLGDHRGLVVRRDGSSIFVDTRDISLAPSLIASGYWERWIDAVVARLTRPGAIAVDLGANFGYYTLIMARAVGPSGKVHAFEANPQVARLLDDTIAINGLRGWVTSRNVAILDRQATVELCVDPSYLGGGRISYSDEVNGFDRYAVNGMTLCDALPGVERIDVLRMDIEGCEPLALLGAGALIRRSPELVIVSEWDVSMMAHHRCEARDLVDWLVGLGFGFWRIRLDSALEPLAAADMLSLPHCDVVMARQRLA